MPYINKSDQYRAFSMFKKINAVWGWLNTPVNLLFKPMPEYDFTEVDEKTDDYWEERKERHSPEDFRKSVRDFNEENAFFRKPENFFKPANGMPSTVMDGMSSLNSAFSLSSNRASDVQLNWFVRQGFIGYQSCALIAQHWLVNRACSLPGKDAIKNGFELTSIAGKKLEPEVIQDIRLLDEQFDLNRNLREFSKMNRTFGIRIMLYVVKSKNKKYYEFPFNIDGVTEGSYQGMVQVDPYWITPELDGDAAGNPSSMYFYEPTYWRINGKLYHRSHLVITRYVEVADVLKPNYIYGGVPLTQMIYERCYAAERSANEAPELLLTKRLFVIKTDTKKAIAQFGAFLNRLAQFTGLKNNQGVQVIDTKEEFDQHDTTMAQVSDVIDGQYDIVAGISEIPISKFMGREITGLGSEGKGSRIDYEDVLGDEQVRLDPVINRHHLLLVKSHIEPKRGPQPVIRHTWNPLTTPTAKEAAEIRKINMDTAKTAVDMGALSPEDVHNKIITDEDSGYSITESDGSDDADYSDYTDEDVNSPDRLFPNSPKPSI